MKKPNQWIIDQLINKYCMSTDMNEVLDYISWRSPPFVITDVRERVLEILNERENMNLEKYMGKLIA